MRSLLFVACLMTAAAAWSGAGAEVKPGKQEGLGLTGPEVPDMLKAIEANPYAQPTGGCEGIADELIALNDVLGPDVDAPKKKDDPGKAVVSGVSSLIPYKGIVRLFTGAGKKEEELIQAAMAASARRGYLRGVEMNMHCAASAEGASSPAAEVGPPPADYLPPADPPVVDPETADLYARPAR
jgi:hypothetical protein